MKGMIDLNKEKFKRRIRKITAFAAAVAMAVTVTMPGEIFGNIDFGITVFAEENGYDNGFCTTYTENGCTNTNHTDCNGYQPATDENNDGVYEIGNAGQLYWFAACVNGSTEGIQQNKSAKAVLTADITVNTGNVANCNGTKATGWTVS